MTNKRHLLLTICLCAIFSISMLNAQEKGKTSKQSSQNDDVVEVEKEDANTVNKWDYFMYPVPASTELTIKVTRGQVSINKVIITNQAGDEVLYLEEQSDKKLKLDLSDLEPGKYFIRVITDLYATPKMKRLYISK